MDSRDDPKLLLGKHVPAADQYSPQLLYPIARSEGRATLGQLPALFGCDIWHAYEVSWLHEDGMPRARIARFVIPADSTFMVESKSFKLYLNSLNGARFSSEEAVIDTIKRDVRELVESDIDVVFFPVDDERLGGQPLRGFCLDVLQPGPVSDRPDSALLRVQKTPVQEGEALQASELATPTVLYTNLLRSLCPVTGQPDWATLRISYRGDPIEQSALLGYLLSFRSHHEFHEQCVERVYADLMRACSPQWLEVQGFYTRRGGMDINPYRCSDAAGQPLGRLIRQ